MIIYFDLSASKIEIIEQRNNNNYFAVDFLMEYSQNRDFEKIIDALCQDSNILNSMRAEKNYVILPDCVVGFDSLEVPTSLFNSKKHFFTKYNLIYNSSKDLVQHSKVICSNKNTQTFAVCMAKKSLIERIIESFKKYSVMVSGVSYFSNVIGEWLKSKQKDLLKDDYILMRPQDKLSIYAISKETVVGTKDIEYSKSKQKIASQFVSFVNNGAKKPNLDAIEDTEKHNRDFKEKTPDEIKREIFQFKYYFENSNLNLKLEKFVVLNMSNSKQIDFEDKSVTNIDTNMKEILMCYKGNAFYDLKKGLNHE